MQASAEPILYPSPASFDAGHPKTDVKIHVYDLLPPGRLASLLWYVGGAVLHSGVVVGDKEYAFGGHNKPGLTGVYWTRPGLVPPGGTFKCEIPMGSSLRTREQIDQIVKEASQKFLGPSWNLLTNNCNHFTSFLCAELTGRGTPTWLNRAASIGISLPCLIPRQWLSPPDADTADGELVETDHADDEDDDEHTAMLKPQREAPDFVYQSESEGSDSDDSFEPRKRGRRRIYGHSNKSDTSAYAKSSGTVLPVSPRASVADD